MGNSEPARHGNGAPDGDAERVATCAERYAAERRRLILTRARWAAGLALLPIAAVALVNVFVFADRLSERLATFGIEAALCVAVLVLGSLRSAERRAIPLALAFVFGMESAQLWALSLSPTDLDVLVSPIVATMVASTLLFPWGVVPQSFASAYLAVGYVLLPPWGALGASRTANVLIGIGLGCVTSVVGAWVLDRQRRATFVEREHVAALARQRALMVEAGRELNGTLELDALVQRIMHQARRLVGCTGASLALVDEARGVIIPVAVFTGDPEHEQQFRGVEFPIDDPAFFVALARRGMLELPEAGTFADVYEYARRLGFARTLYVAIQRDGRLLGILSFAGREKDPPLTEQHRSLAEGIAHQAAIALANAQLVDDLRTASRVKTEFVSTMSHELRTPLHVILGFAEMARDLAVDAPERVSALQGIEAAGRDLLGLIESMLEVGRIEAGRDEVRLAPVPLSTVWTELGEVCARLPRADAVQLAWVPDVPAVSLVTDRRKLGVIMRNLVGNALKFTEQGWVRADVRADGDVVVLRVADTGIGIRTEDRDAIFEMFRQADGSDSRLYGGTGLGLYLVRRFAEQLGGTVSVESAPGRGSVFTVRLPVSGTSVQVAA